MKNLDFASFLAREPGRFDIAFLDPPYRTGLLQRALPMTAAAMNPGGTIICEHPADEELPGAVGILSGCVPPATVKFC